jgi:hypothetical protein
MGNQEESEEAAALRVPEPERHGAANTLRQEMEKGLRQCWNWDKAFPRFPADCGSQHG